MARYIDSEKAKFELTNSMCIDSWIFSELVDFQAGRKNIEEVNNAIQDTVISEINRIFDEMINENRYCDCCGKVLTKENNKCGYNICDNCNADMRKESEEEE